MWFAFKIYIFDILIQLFQRLSFLCCVVICFQNLYLWYSDTTCVRIPTKHAVLWFAFKIYIFDILIQPVVKLSSVHLCCDLLSKFISLIFWYNNILWKSSDIQLWFAFKIYIFDILIQRANCRSRRCRVVICFQNLYLWYSDTTNGREGFYYAGLWFAFKIYIFDILIQQESLTQKKWWSCDLLSKFISLIFWYNMIVEKNKCTLVVICFQNLYLWYSDTTWMVWGKRFRGCDLLSKFISLIFWYNLFTRATGWSCCDLLSKFISLIFWYNLIKKKPRCETVVICFQNLYLWYSDTTATPSNTFASKLWFAFKIYIFDILIQL